MKTFKQFITEEMVDDSPSHDYRTKAKDAMHAISKEVGKVLKVMSYKVPITYSSQQASFHGYYNVKGDTYVLKVDVPEEMDSDFFAKMVGKLVGRELKKRFNRYKVLESELVRFTSESGVKIDCVYVTFLVPDADGTFSVNTQP